MLTGSIIQNPSSLLKGSTTDQIEDRSAYLRSDDSVTWSGTQLSFVEDIDLEIINTSNGTITRHRILAANSPISIADGESIYVEIDRTQTLENVTPVNSGVTPIPAHSDDNRDIFVLFRRVVANAISYLHIPLHKQVLSQGQTTVLGAAGSGGSSLEIQENGVQISAAATILNFTGSVQVTEGAPGEVTVLIAGGGGSSLHYDLKEEETGRHLIEEPLNFIDAFKNSNKGTHTNLEIANGTRSQLSGSNLTGSYEREREVTTRVGSVETVVTAGIRGLRPQNNGVNVTGTAEIYTVLHNNTGSFFDVVGAGKYWQGDGFYVWFNVTDGVNSPQTDPGGTGTGYQVNILLADTAAQIAGKEQAVTDLIVGITVTNLSATNTYTYDAVGTHTDPTIQTSGTTITVTQQGVAANTVYFNGDVSGYLAATKKLVVYRSLTTDGKSSYIWLTNSNNNYRPEIFTISSVSYDSGTDVTTVVITNPDTLALAMGVAGANQNEQLRFAPWNYTLQGKATTGAYETMDLIDAHGTEDTVLFGENFIALVGIPTGKTLTSNSKSSPDGTQIVIVSLEATTGNTRWNFIVSTDGGASWALAGTRDTDPAATGNDEEFADISGGFVNSRGHKIVVTNSGLAVACYASGTIARAVSIDLGAPSVTDFVTNGSGAGIVRTTPGDNQRPFIAADEVDLSFVAVTTIDDNSDAFTAVYTNAGATFVEIEALGTEVSSTDGFSQRVTGTSGNHQLHTLSYNVTTGKTNYRRYDESGSAYGSVVATTLAGNHVPQSVYWDFDNDRVIVVAMQGLSVDGVTLHTFEDITGTPVLGDEITLFNSNSRIEGDVLNNWKTDNTNSTNYDGQGSRVIVDPADPNHLFVLVNIEQPGGIGNVKEPILFEIPDLTSYGESLVAQYSNGGSDTPLRSAASLTMIGQTFTLAGGDIRTVGILLHQATTSTVASGTTLSCHIYNTSAGLPTTLIATSPITFDASKISRFASNDGQFLFFTFDDPALEGLTGTYAWVLSADYAIDATHHVSVMTNVTNPYAGGTEVRFDGSVWSSIGANDLVFLVASHWINNVEERYPQDRQTHHFGYDEWYNNPQMVLLNSTTIEYAVRKGYRQWNNAGAAVNTQHNSGHVYRRTITINGGGAKATIGDREIIGYNSDNFDNNLIYSCAFGTEDYRRRNVETGVENLNFQSENRSGITRDHSALTTVSSDFTDDVDFDTGRCLVLSGTNPTIQYTASSSYRLWSNRRNNEWIMEVEYKPTAGSLSSARAFCSKSTGFGATAGGWQFGHNASGFLQFSVVVSGAPVLTTASSEALSAGVKGKFFAWFDQSDDQVHLGYESAGAIVEVTSYSSQPTINTTNISFDDSVFIIGQSATGAEDAFGRMGIIKIAVGSKTFAGNNLTVQFQPAIRPFLLHNINGKPLYIAEQLVGEMSGTDEDVSYDRLVTMQPQANEQAIGDERGHVLTYQKFLAAEGTHPHVKLNYERVSIDDDTFIDGIHAQFRKLG